MNEHSYITLFNKRSKNMQTTVEKPCGCENKLANKKPCNCDCKSGPSGSRSSESLESRKERLEKELQEVNEQLDK
jgi:hypothetical protein